MMNNIENIDINENVEKIETPDKREILKGEKFLLLIALIISVLCDRLFLNILINNNQNEIWNVFYFTAIFEICFTVLFCIVNFKKIYKKPYLWVIAGLIIILCIWNFIFDYVSNYGILNFLVIPASLMMFTQIATENIDLKNLIGIIISWFTGWIIKPFVAIHKCIEVFVNFLFPKGKANKSVFIKVLMAILITVPLIVLLVFLLSGADKIFGLYANKILASFDIYDFILHGVLIAVGFLLFYSFFWYGKYGNPNNSIQKVKKEYKADNLILYIILSSVLILYILFCIIQFAYLFPNANPPEGISYAEYAREGFAQIVVISGINLIIFGCMLKFGKIYKKTIGDGVLDVPKKDIVLNIMLYILVLVTGIMLVSGFMRLGLYINTFGMTFLRLISAWFIIYLSVVWVLCVARLIKEKLPLVSCCAVLLLIAYNILGYINPDAFIVQYNLSEYSKFDYADKWIEENRDYITNILSDDAINILLENGLDKDKYFEILKERYNYSLTKHSFSSIKLRLNLEELFIDSSQSP